MGDKLLVETRVTPKDIAFIKVGDKALVKVTAYDFSTYGGLDGRVVQVSADSIYDEATREAYFNVIVETTRAYLEGAGPAAADHAGDDHRHADHHRAQERAELFAQAGDEGAQRRAARALAAPVSARRTATTAFRATSRAAAPDAWYDCKHHRRRSSSGDSRG